MDNFLKKQKAYIIGEQYGMFPQNKMRFEMELQTASAGWGFFANRSNRTVLHIKFQPNALDDPE